MYRNDRSCRNCILLRMAHAPGCSYKLLRCVACITRSNTRRAAAFSSFSFSRSHSLSACQAKERDTFHRIDCAKFATWFLANDQTRSLCDANVMASCAAAAMNRENGYPRRAAKCEFALIASINSTAIFSHVPVFYGA